MSTLASDRSSDLQSIPGVGPKIAQSLRALGCRGIEDLAWRDPQRRYDDLCRLRGAPVDRCVLYVFRCAVYYAGRRRHDPELLKWWSWKDD